MTEKSKFKKDIFLSQVFKKPIYKLQNNLIKKIKKTNFLFSYIRTKKKNNNIKKNFKTAFVQKEILFEKSFSNNKNSYSHFQSDITVLRKKKKKFYSKKKRELLSKLCANSFTKSRFFEDKNINIKIAKKIKFLWTEGG